MKQKLFPRSMFGALFILAGMLSLRAAEPAFPGTGCPPGSPRVTGPTFSLGQVPTLPNAQAEGCDHPLPITLATALKLAGARPFVIATAEASVQVAAAELARAKAAALPDLNLGAGYYHHDGGTEGQSGTFYINSKDQFLGGGGLFARLSTADALFGPLIARQVLKARQIDVDAARNDALLATAEAYFNVQQARGRLAGTLDVLAKGEALRQKIRAQLGGPLAPTDFHRAQTVLAEVEQTLETAREQWRLASADLTEVLTLESSAVIVPLEPPQMSVTLIRPQECLDDLVPIGLTNRPELAAQQALVQATLARIRQERARPLMPNVVLQGGSNPSDASSQLMGGVFGSGVHGAGNPWSARDDVSLGLVWQLQNLGLGNRALVRERRAEQQQAAVDLLRLEKRVAGDVVRAHATLTSANRRLQQAETGVQEAILTYEGSLEEMGKITKVEDIKVVTRRAFEVISALQALLRAYDNYFGTVGDYNRAQFRLFHALGYPASLVASEKSCGETPCANRP